VAGHLATPNLIINPLVNHCRGIFYFQGVYDAKTNIQTFYPQQSAEEKIQILLPRPAGNDLGKYPQTLVTHPNPSKPAQKQPELFHPHRSDFGARW